uniref:serine protease n=1 Tax=Lactococcus garvieae TaxID=1363 RepID=UPI00359C108B
MTKKQIVIGSVVALALVAGGAGVTAHHHAKVEADKLAQMAKNTHNALLKDAQAATQKAEGFKNEADVKTAEKAIQRLNKKDQTALTARLKVVKDNWIVANKAEQAVIKAEKNKTEADVKNAQKAIDQLKATMTRAKKSALQHRLDKVKQGMKATKAKAEQAQAEAQTQAFVQSQNTPASNATGDTGAQSAETNSAPAPTYNQAPAPAYSAPETETPSGPQAQPAPSYNVPVPSAPASGTASAPAQSSNNTGNPAYNSGAGANADPNMSIEQGNKDNEYANAHPYGDGMSVNGGR